MWQFWPIKSYEKIYNSKVQGPGHVCFVFAKIWTSWDNSKIQIRGENFKHLKVIRNTLSTNFGFYNKWHWKEKLHDLIDLQIGSFETKILLENSSLCNDFWKLILMWRPYSLVEYRIFWFKLWLSKLSWSKKEISEKKKNSSALLRKTVNVLVQISRQKFCQFQIKILHGSDDFR